MDRVVIAGLGYVGTVTAVVLASGGAEVLGVDIDRSKAEALAAGRPLLVEPGVTALAEQSVRSGRLSAGTELPADNSADLGVVCVGTPSAPDGTVDMGALRQAVLDLAKRLPASAPIVIRSTVPPGTCDGILKEFAFELESRELVFVPEFLREGSAVSDFERPPVTVVGCEKGVVPPIVLRYFASRDPTTPHFEVSFATAETVKYAANAFHALKVTFGNEVGRIAAAVGANPNQVADIFVSDTKLNISPAYLRPGGPYGGSCLPKDARALAAIAQQAQVGVPIIDALSESNRKHLAHVVTNILHRKPRSVGILGIAFKSRTDDVRESPALELLHDLVRAGVSVIFFDAYVDDASILGSNRREYELATASGAVRRATSIQEVIESTDIIIRTNDDASYRGLELRAMEGVFDWQELL